MTKDELTLGYAQTSDLCVHYAEWTQQLPQAQSSAPIVMLHGLSSTLHIWDIVAPQLSDNHRVIALDQRGHGLTTQPNDGYDLDTSSDDVIAFNTAIGLPEPFWLIGHSWGAAVALNTASRYPNHVRGLVLVDGGALDLKQWLPTWAEAEARLTPPSLSHLTLEELRVSMRQHWLQAAWSPDAENAAMYSFEEDANGQAQRRLNLRNHMQIAQHLWAFTPADHFPKITCPVLITPARGYGDPLRDETRTEVIASTAAQLTHIRCQVIWFDDTIHDIPWHRPTELATVINSFIQG